jgi:hypothetical protein
MIYEDISVERAKQLVREGWGVGVRHHPELAEYHVTLSKHGEKACRAYFPYVYLASINKEINGLIAEQKSINAHIVEMLVKYLKIAP